MALDYNLFDEDPDAPFLKQQALAENVRRNPALATPSSGVDKPRTTRTSYSVTQGGTPGAADATLQAMLDRIGKPPEEGPLMKYAQARRDQANQNMLMGLALSAKG